MDSLASFKHAALGTRDVHGGTNVGVWIAVGVAFGLIFLAIIGNVLLRYFFHARKPRSTSNGKPSIFSGGWRGWHRYGRVSKDNVLHPESGGGGGGGGNDIEISTSYAPSIEISAPPTTSTGEAGVNRNTSVRSIMTLPPYRPSPRHDEQLIAREGERAGVDTVIEFPETEETSEARRNEEMEALFQIRQARRREQEEREARRNERREAREAGDWARLEQLRLQSQMRARAGSGASLAPSAGSSQTDLQNTSDYLIAELTSQRESNERGRRVSEVSYADLGLARHDGSRIRADSVESDNRPLLDSAAGMGGATRSRASSRASSPYHGSSANNRPGGAHRRDISGTSFATFDSTAGPGAVAPASPLGNGPSQQPQAQPHVSELPTHPSPPSNALTPQRSPETPAASSSSGGQGRSTSGYPGTGSGTGSGTGTGTGTGTGSSDNDTEAETEDFSDPSNAYANAIPPPSYEAEMKSQSQQQHSQQENSRSTPHRPPPRSPQLQTSNLPHLPDEDAPPYSSPIFANSNVGVGVGVGESGSGGPISAGPTSATSAGSAGSGVFRIPTLRRLPAIDVINATPAGSEAGTPVDGHLQSLDER